ncbi:MAG: hypothetical protein EOS81_31035 [Mesorhizobium sp.]|uniref:hypothetical protein n=2 Tax=Mesorhizobium TaxID=68287 RepID=UPI000F765999|nr:MULTISPECIES: hypothetical protein [unclassified Mesorhizobium]RVC60477.1 hypothetical protein EN759_30850 [Mesorhizobium sp. M00.F.Ca.ET.038.03.1.1]AZO38835.1 hypothetical protein EJ072_33540 [Mesorhizobium sp. M2A.F.Ca.ET.046.03.2.1]RWB43534.1 MAG: hypothetical protein EOQ44_17850 [Mesorhizobium sp.]RWE16170.1 MAG: hypothetical protein EOS76_21310 [Mesorhizobium sp.]RWE84116.1 MAG: hypothetical protein EOS81_31035 [Mesorhizobium sp.]
MKHCFLNIVGERVFVIPMVTTRDGWEMFAGPVILVGELPSISDKDIGASTLSAIRAHVSGVPDEIVDKVLLNRSASRFGFRSYNSFLWKSRQMSVDQQGEDKFKLIPYAKVNRESAVPLDTIFYSTGTPGDLGRAVRDCIELCR